MSDSFERKLSNSSALISAETAIAVAIVVFLVLPLLVICFCCCRIARSKRKGKLQSRCFCNHHFNQIDYVFQFRSQERSEVIIRIEEKDLDDFLSVRNFSGMTDLGITHYNSSVSLPNTMYKSMSSLDLSFSSAVSSRSRNNYEE